MTCREAQADLALFAGGDLDDRARVKDLREHVGGCRECRRHYQSLKATVRRLAGVGPVAAAATWESAGSLWPSIRREISMPPQTLTAGAVLQQVRNWAPFAAMTAACVLMLLALNFQGSTPEQPVSRRGMAAHPPLALQPHDESAPPRYSESESTRALRPIDTSL